MSALALGKKREEFRVVIFPAGATSKKERALSGGNYLERSTRGDLLLAGLMCGEEKRRKRWCRKLGRRHVRGEERGDVLDCRSGRIETICSYSEAFSRYGTSKAQALSLVSEARYAFMSEARSASGSHIA